MEVLQPHPPGFKDISYTFDVKINADPEAIWIWLNATETFTDNQVWPFKVEFYSPNKDKIPEGFNVGVYTNHFGPSCFPRINREVLKKCK